MSDENVQNALNNILGGMASGEYPAKAHGPNGAYVPQQTTSDHIPLTARQVGGLEPLPQAEKEEDEDAPLFPGSAAEEVARSAAKAIPEAASEAAGKAREWIETQPLYRTLMLTDEQKLEDAKKIADTLGMNANVLATNQWLYDDAKKAYDNIQKQAFLNGRPFSADTIRDMYPEVDLSNPVQAALALKHAKEVLAARDAVQETGVSGLAKSIEDEWDLIKKGWHSGEAGSEIAKIWGQEDRGEISLEDAEAQVKELQEKAKLPENMGFLNKAITGALQNINRNNEAFPAAIEEGVNYAEAGLENVLGMKQGSIYQFLNRNMALPSAWKNVIRPILANPVTGLAIQFTPFAKGVVYASSFRDSYYDDYSRMRTDRDAYGRFKYTKDEARRLAAGEAAVQAGIETLAWQVALGPVAKAVGMGPAAALISNTAAMRSLINAGTGAARKTALRLGGIQFAKGAASEITEEGLQDLTSSIVENSLGHDNKSFKEIMESAGNAMIEAVPSVIGMMALPGAVHGATMYRGMKRISTTELKEAQEEIKRTQEKSMVDNLIALRDKSTLFKKSKESYTNTIQNRLDREDMGTMYIDAQAASEDENTHEALNRLVETGAVSAEELDDSIKTGKALEVQTGKYMQEATPEMNEALQDYTTMDKGERTLHDIALIRERAKKTVDKATAQKEERTMRAAQALVDETYPEQAGDTQETRDDRMTFASLLSGGITDIQDNWKKALDSAKQEWIRLLPQGEAHIKYIADKQKGQGNGEVGITYREGEGGQWETTISSSNEGWYGAAYKELGHQPTQREILELDTRDAIREIQDTADKNDVEAQSAIQDLENAQKAVESLERVGDVIKDMDKADLAARAQLEPETYSEVYKPFLSQIREAAKGTAAEKAARESALVLSKIAENIHKSYGLPLQIARIVAARTAPGNAGIVYQADAESTLAEDEKNFSEAVDNFMAGKLKGDKAITMMQTPLVFTLTGAEILPLNISNATMVKVLEKDGRHGHGGQITPDILKQLPRAMADPMMIFSTYPEQKTGQKRIVIVVDLKDKNGATIVVPVEFDKSPEDARGYRFNRIVSVFGKTEKGHDETPNYTYFEDNAKAGNLVYINTKKTANWIQHEKLETLIPHLPVDGLSKLSIPNENDLDKLRKLRPALYQMAGQGANNAPMEQLQQAMGMERDGKAAREIWDATGWVHGVDGRWRFEIPDNYDRIDLSGAVKYADGGSVLLGTVYDNPRLYEAYPFLRYIPVRIEDFKKNYGGTTAVGFSDGTSIHLDKQHLLEKGEEETKATLVHEIQHIIQKHEGFAGGGNAATARETARQARQKYQDRLNALLADNPEGQDYAASYYESLEDRKEPPHTSLDKELRSKIERLTDWIYAINRAMNLSDHGIYAGLAGEREAYRASDRAKLNTIRERNREQLKKEYEEAVAELENAEAAMTPEEKKAAEQYSTNYAKARENFKKAIASGRESEMETAFNELKDVEQREPKTAALRQTVMRAKELLDTWEPEKEFPGHEVNQNLVVVFDSEELPFAQAQEPDLVVTHNTTEDKLEKSIQLGGLPMPSLGITRKDIRSGLEGFGGITLIGNRDMIDPQRSSKNDVFSRDAYTGTFPRIEYDNPKASAITAFYRKFKDVYAAFDRLSSGDSLASIEYKLQSGMDRDRLQSDMERSEPVQKYFVENVLGKQVKVYTKHGAPDRAGVVKSATIRKQLLKGVPEYGSPEYIKLSGAIRKRLIEAEEVKIRKEHKWEGKEREYAEFIVGTYFDNDGNYNSNLMRDLYYSAKRHEKVGVDYERFHKSVDRYIYKYDKNGSRTVKPEFEKWINSELDQLYKNPSIRVGKKKVPLTLDNVVASMLKKRGSATQGNLTFGDNELLAGISKKFKSIAQIKKAEGELAPDNSSESKSHYGAFQDAMNEIRSVARSAYQWPDGWDVFDDLNRALVQAAKGKVTDEKILSALRKYGFTKEPEKLLDNAKDAIGAAKGVMTDYFEAKPARAVSFNEFSGAVVPKGTKKSITDFLKSQGIKVKTYDPKVEGDQHEKTQELASTLNVYFQNGSRFQGSYDPNANVIELFSGANASTPIHEGAHMFLTMLEQAGNMTAEELAGYMNGDVEAAQKCLDKIHKDLATINEWAAPTEDHINEYKGTGLEKEFTGHAEDVRQGKPGAEERFRQERFARGFEKYLMEGSAPTRELQGVFRRFKAWLLDIYQSVKALGKVELTPEIRDVYDRMLATQEEIDAWAAQRKLESIDRVVDVNTSELGNLREWAENVKAKAAEMALSDYMRTTKEEAVTQYRESISTDEQKEAFIEDLVNPQTNKDAMAYQADRIRNAGVWATTEEKKAGLQLFGFASEKELDDRLKEAGGTLEERWQQHIDEMVQQYKDNALTPETVRAMAEAVLASPEGLEKKSAIEADLLQKKVTSYIALVTSMQLNLKRAKDKAKVAAEIRKRLGIPAQGKSVGDPVALAKSREKVERLENQVKRLKDQLDKARKEASSEKRDSEAKTSELKRLEGNISALNAELDKERNKNKEQEDTAKDTEATIADLSEQLRIIVDGLKESRDAMRVNRKPMREDAINTLGEETISHATSWQWWQNKAQIAETRAMKAAGENDWDAAAHYRESQAQCLAFAKEARKNEEEIRKALHGGGKLTTAQQNDEGLDRYGILGMLNRIGRKEKPVMMKDDARYFVQHLAYMVGMTKKDGLLPIDQNGQERPFSWEWLATELNPDQAMLAAEKGTTYLGDDVIAPWIKNIFENQRLMNMRDLTMNQFRDIVRTLKAVYKLGRREYEGNTLGTSFDNAAFSIAKEVNKKFFKNMEDPYYQNLRGGTLQNLKLTARKYLQNLTLPEVMLERLGESAYKYLYVPIDKAAKARREMKARETKKIQEIFKTYSRSEWAAMRRDRKYQFGFDERGNKVYYTKEEVIAMALNWGTQSNRDRVSETVSLPQDAIQEFLEENMTDKDWDFVEKIWNHLDEFWGDRNKVQNDLYGVPLGKVPGITFTLKNGRTIQGKYYRIKYDPNTSSRARELSINEIASQGMQGISAFSLGMGSTKGRKQTAGGQKLRLDLQVYPEAVGEAVQHITMREATVDVFKLLGRPEVRTSIEEVMGIDGYNILRNWASDNWHSPLIEANDWASLMDRMRGKYTFATMAYRTSTALLNLLNILGLMDRMGPINALTAVAKFYLGSPNIAKHYMEQRNFIMQKSSMMRERSQNMDRDMARGDALPAEKNESNIHSAIVHGKFGTEEINRWGYWFITETDYMFSLPEWLATYQGNFRKLQAEGKTIEEADAGAVRLADKAVRETFGSGEVKDRPALTRGNSLIAQITPFYSYTNLVLNQFIRAGYIVKDEGRIKPLISAILFWYVFQAFAEGCFRAAWSDDDDEDKRKKKIVYAFANGGPFGGIPIVRDVLPWAVNLAQSVYAGDPTPDIAGLDAIKVVGDSYKALLKGDYIEMGRNANKVLNRTYLGFSDTLSDGLWSAIRMITTDTKYNASDYIYSLLFDKPLKAEKKKKKAKKGGDTK